MVEPHSFRHLLSQLALLLSWQCLPLGWGEGAEEVEDEPVGAEEPPENLPCQVDEVDSGVEDDRCPVNPLRSVVVGEGEVVVEEGAVV